MAAEVGIHAPARFLPVTGSTNADLLAMAEAGAPEWTLVVAGHQEAGRGRLGRSWVSAPGSSLLLSLLLRPRVPPVRAPLLSLGAAAGMAEALRKACGVEARTRWPNDLVAGGRKLGGVLAEASVGEEGLRHVVVGIGVNLVQAPDDFPPEIRATATSVAQEGGRPDPVGLLRAFLWRVRRTYTPEEGFGPQAVPRFRELCDTLGRTVRATTVAGASVAGRAAGLGAGGELLVETTEGVRAVAFGEVLHLD